MSFYDRFVFLCNQKGVKPSRAASECNINRSNVTNWKNNGYTPRGDVLQRIAEYFEVPVDVLLGLRYDCPDDENPHEVELRDAFDKLDIDSQIQAVKAVKEIGNKKTPVLTQKDERDIARNLEKIMDDLENSGDLMFDGDPMSDEARESIRSALKLGLEAAKLKNKEIYTPKKYRKG